GQALALRFDRERRKTFGHTMPELAAPKTTGVPHPSPYGTTHEFTIIKAPGRATTMAAASNPDHSRCDIADGWLREAYLRKGGANGGPLKSARGWDSHSQAVNPERARIYISRDRSKGSALVVQFRHKLSPNEVRYPGRKPEKKGPGT